MAKINIIINMTYNFIEILQIHQRFPAFFFSCITDTVRLVCVTIILCLLKVSAAMDYDDIQHTKTFHGVLEATKGNVDGHFIVSKVHQD